MEHVAGEVEKVIRIKIQQVRNKKVTKIENVPDEVKEDVLMTLKKKMACGGSKQEDGSIQVQGDKSHTDIVQLIKKMCDGYKVEMNGKIV